MLAVFGVVGQVLDALTPPVAAPGGGPLQPLVALLLLLPLYLLTLLLYSIQTSIL